MGTVTTSGVTNAIQTHLDNVLLMEASAPLVHTLFGRRGTIPKNAGETIKFVRINSLAAATTPLTEGTNPDATEWGKTEVTAEVSQYGAYVEQSDLKLDTENDAVLNGVAVALGKQAGKTRDLVCRDVINGGTSVIRAGGVAARTDIVSTLSKPNLDSIVTQLATGNADAITGFIRADNSAVEQVDPCYPVFVHPHLKSTIVSVCGDDFIPVRKYRQNTAVFPGEFGSYDNLRFIANTNAKVWTDGGGDVGVTGLRSTSGTKVDVYSLLAVGQEAYGTVALAEGENANMIVKPKETAGGALELSATIGWKLIVKDVILNDDFMCRLECGCSV